MAAIIRNYNPLVLPIVALEADVPVLMEGETVKAGDTNNVWMGTKEHVNVLLAPSSGATIDGTPYRLPHFGSAGDTLEDSSLEQYYGTGTGIRVLDELIYKPTDVAASSSFFGYLHAGVPEVEGTFCRLAWTGGGSSQVINIFGLSLIGSARPGRRMIVNLKRNDGGAGRGFALTHMATGYPGVALLYLGGDFEPDQTVRLPDDSTLEIIAEENYWRVLNVIWPYGGPSTGVGLVPEFTSGYYPRFFLTQNGWDRETNSKEASTGIIAGDSGWLLWFNQATDTVCTIDAIGEVGFERGFKVYLFNQGVGRITITPDVYGSGSTHLINGEPTLVLEQGDWAILFVDETFAYAPSFKALVCRDVGTGSGDGDCPCWEDDPELFALSELDSGSSGIPHFTGAGAAELLDFDIDGTLAANSDTTVPSQKAVKTYVDGAVTGLWEFKGAANCSANPNYPAALKGDAYVVTHAGRIGGASGKQVDIGDFYVAIADNAGGDEATVGTSWAVLEHNLVGALLSANNLSDVASVATSRTNLGLGTADSPEFTALNLGHASDTTLGRGAAGFIAVEGNRVPSPASQAQGDLLYRDTTEWARLAKDTNSTRYLSNQGSSNNPSWNQVNLANGVTGTLPVGNGGTGTTSAIVPVGTILPWAGAGAVPTGFLACDGSTASQATYPALYAVLGTTWGSDSGGNFTLPDFRRRVPMGSGGTKVATAAPANTVGSTGGSETNTLTTTTMPAHTHGVGYTPGGGGGFLGILQSVMAFGSQVGSMLSDPNGSSAAHDNVQPSAVVQFIIKT